MRNDLPRSAICLAATMVLTIHAAYAEDSPQWVVFSDVQDQSSAVYPSGFGAAVAMVGNTAFIGVPLYTDSVSYPTFHGRVAVYDNSAANAAPGMIQDNWNRTGSIVPSDQRPGETQFGNALSAQGSRLAIGSLRSVRMYEKRQGQWVPLDTIFWPANETVTQPVMVYDQDILAYRVLKQRQHPRPDGSTTVSIVYTYRIDSAGKAHLLQKLKAPAGNYGDFGAALALKNGRLAIGSPGETSSADPAAAGLVYVYSLSDTTWQLQQTLTPAVAMTNTKFGSAVAFAQGGILIGAPGESPVLESGQLVQQGAVHFFTRNQGKYVDTQDFQPESSSTGAYAGFGAIMAAAGDHVVIGAPVPLSYNLAAAQGVNGEIMIYDWEAGTWVFGYDNFNSPPTSMAATPRYLLVGGDQTPAPDSSTEATLNEANLFDYGKPSAPTSEE
jgi:hypothetical protein